MAQKKFRYTPKSLHGLKNALNINKQNGVTGLPCCFPRIRLCHIVHGLDFLPDNGFLIRGQFNKTFTLVIYKSDRPLYLQAQTKTSLINIVTSPSYKCPTCHYRCSATLVKYGKYQI